MNQTTSNRPTMEELTKARDYILLPHILAMVERSAEEMERSRNILQRLYVKSAQIIIEMIRKDLLALKQELRKSGIQVLEDNHDATVYYSKVICRGYEERFGIMRDVMKAEISVRLGKYVAEVTKRLQ